MARQSPGGPALRDLLRHRELGWIWRGWYRVCHSRRVGHVYGDFGSSYWLRWGHPKPSGGVRHLLGQSRRDRGPCGGPQLRHGGQLGRRHLGLHDEHGEHDHSWWHSDCANRLRPGHPRCVLRRRADHDGFREPRHVPGLNRWPRVGGLHCQHRWILRQQRCAGLVLRHGLLGLRRRRRQQFPRKHRAVRWRRQRLQRPSRLPRRAHRHRWRWHTRWL